MSKLIFDPEIYCTAAETAELDGTAPLALAGDGLWVGVLPAGRACWAALTARAKAAIFCWALPPGTDAAERLPPAGRAADRPLAPDRYLLRTGGGAAGRTALPAPARRS